MKGLSLCVHVHLIHLNKNVTLNSFNLQTIVQLAIISHVSDTVQ
jgi:hypothetical protein